MPGRREAHRLQLQARHDAEGIVRLEEADVAAVHVGLQERLLGGELRSLQSQRVVAVLDPKPVGGDAAGQDPDGHLGVGARLLRRRQDHGRRPIADRGAIVQTQGSLDHARGQRFLGTYPHLVEERVRIVAGVLVGVHGEPDHGVRRRAGAFEVERHQLGIAADHRRPVGDLALRVQRLGNGRQGHAFTHALHAHGHRQVRLAAGHR